ncbi:MAG: hypothetical protein AB7H48_06920, partial [Parachlamydiales bacterium]
CLKVHDGMLFSSSGDHMIKIWDLATGQLFRSLAVPEDDIYCMEVNDGMLIVGLGKGMVKIFDFTPPSEKPAT